jgi:hypothetical protein
MRVLIGNMFLHTIGGSESFTHAVAEELLRRGHEVDLFAPNSGASVYADDLGIELNQLHGDYDAALVSHYPVVNMVLEKFSYLEGRIIQTCHGLIPTLEKPNPWARLVVISEEIQHVHGGTLVRNGVNLDRFKPSHPLPEKPERLLSLSQSDEFNAMLSEVCFKRDIELRTRNKNVNPVFDVSTDIMWADIVVAIGRSAIEAMACWRAVLLADNRAYQGPLSDSWAGINIADGLGPVGSNYSGRYFRFQATQAHIEKALSIYQPELGTWARKQAEYDHDIRRNIQRYFEIVN